MCKVRYSYGERTTALYLDNYISYIRKYKNNICNAGFLIYFIFLLNIKRKKSIIWICCYLIYNIYYKDKKMNEETIFAKRECSFRSKGRKDGIFI